MSGSQLSATHREAGSLSEVGDRGWRCGPNRGVSSRLRFETMPADRGYLCKAPRGGIAATRSRRAASAAGAPHPSSRISQLNTKKRRIRRHEPNRSDSSSRIPWVIEPIGPTACRVLASSVLRVQNAFLGFMRLDGRGRMPSCAEKKPPMISRPSRKAGFRHLPGWRNWQTR